MPEASLEGARQKAERIRSAVKALALTYRDRPLGTITVSLGVAMFPVDAADQESLIRAADEALYAAYRCGAASRNAARSRSVSPNAVPAISSVRR